MSAPYLVVAKRRLIVIFRLKPPKTCAGISQIASSPVEMGANHIAAYYTISAASIPLADLPPDDAKRLPRYPTVPAVRIGRLAVDQRFQGRGLGAALLADAAARTLNADAAAFTLLVDAKTDQAAAFYQRFGFRILVSRPRTLFLPRATAEKAFLKKRALSS